VQRHLPLTGDKAQGYRWHRAPATHPHNAALQLWVETGAVGVAAGLTLLGLGAIAIRRMDRQAQAIALAATAALLVVAMLSYGLWQETWLGLIGGCVALIRLAALAPADGLEAGRSGATP
jgi:O-antigen ligase